MALWLFKEEPEHYAFDDLERDGAVVWDGVTNNLALQNLRKVRKGDRVLFYHTGKEKAVVGTMCILSGPRPADGIEDPRIVVVEVEPIGRLARPVLLSEIKNDKMLADWDLVRLPRLSVMPVSERQWQRIEELAGQK